MKHNKVRISDHVAIVFQGAEAAELTSHLAPSDFALGP